MTDTKTGFIVTYYRSSEKSEEFLNNLIDVISRENYYLILATHTPVSESIQSKCDFYIYQHLNVIDDRKYSHGVAENNLIHLSLLHLQSQGIEETFKVSYDVIINDVSHFNKWRIKPYNFVTCKWGEYNISTNSFFGKTSWLLKNITFYKTIEEMFSKSNILESCWQQDIVNKGLMGEVYSFPDKKSFFGDLNKIDSLFYEYDNINFWYDSDKNLFYISNNGSDYDEELRIFDYYTDVCIYQSPKFNHPKGITMWISPPVAENVKKSKNGFYLEIYHPNGVIRKNHLIKDFDLKDPLHKKFRTFKRTEVKFNEYSDFNELEMYNNLNIDLDSITNFVDVGSCFGFASMPFIRRGIKTYMIDADVTNVKILNDNYGHDSRIKVIGKAVCDVDGTVDFYHQQDVSVVSSLYNDNVNGDGQNRTKVTVPAMTPNTLLSEIDEEEIDLMKIDIEGAEYTFFETISDDNLSKIKKIIIEFHNNDNFEVVKIITKLAKNNFSYKLFNWGHFTDSYIIGNKMGIIYAQR